MFTLPEPPRFGGSPGRGEEKAMKVDFIQQAQPGPERDTFVALPFPSVSADIRGPEGDREEWFMPTAQTVPCQGGGTLPVWASVEGHVALKYPARADDGYPPDDGIRVCGGWSEEAGAWEGSWPNEEDAPAADADAYRAAVIEVRELKQLAYLR